MDTWIWIVIGVVAIALVTLWGYFHYRNKNAKLRQKGLKGEKKVARILKKKCIGRPWKVINDIYLPLYDKTTQVDHILIGPFGVLAVETKNYAGQVYGSPSDKEWTHICGDEKHKFYNPMMQNKTHVDNIRYLFSKENIYNINIDSLVVFADKKLELYMPKNLPVIRINKLKKELRKSKYDKDNGVDVDKLYNALMNNRVTDQKLIKKHNKNVKKMAKMNR